MDENVQHDLMLACRRLAQQMSEDDQELDKTDRSRKSKAKKEALQALLRLGDQGRCSWDIIGDLLWAVYESSPVPSQTRQQVAQMLLGWAKRRDIPFYDAVEAAYRLYRISANESEEKRQAIQMLLTQARWPDISMKQSVEAVTALCYASPFRSKERDQGILVLLELAQDPELSIEDALAFITLDFDFVPVSIIDTASALLKKRQLAVRKQLLEALTQRSDLTSEQALQITEALSVFSDTQPRGYHTSR